MNGTQLIKNLRWLGKSNELMDLLDAKDSDNDGVTTKLPMKSQVGVFLLRRNQEHNNGNQMCILMIVHYARPFQK